MVTATLLSSYCTTKRIENCANSDLGESHNLAQKVCPFIKVNKANYSVLCANSLNDTVHVYLSVSKICHSNRRQNVSGRRSFQYYSIEGFDVLLTVHLTIILATDHLNAQTLVL